MTKRKPSWTIISRVHLGLVYAECRDGPGTETYYFFDGTRHDTWEALEKALMEKKP